MLLAVFHTLSISSSIIIYFQGDNSVFAFGFADSTTTVPFAVDPSTGVITVNGSLDYETTQQYSFMVGILHMHVLWWYI